MSTLSKKRERKKTRSKCYPLWYTLSRGVVVLIASDCIFFSFYLLFFILSYFFCLQVSRLVRKEEGGRETLRLIIWGKPGQALVESVPCRRTRRLNVPIPISDPRQAQLLLDLVWFHGIWEVLLVGEDEDDGVPHLPVVDDAVELLPRLVDPIPVGTVHHKN